MKTVTRIFLIGSIITVVLTGGVHAQRTILLSSINWEPYTGEHLPNHGFFSEIVATAFSRVGYEVEYQYRSWARALKEAKEGDVNGVMDAYWKPEREAYLSYPDVVCRVQEVFIALSNHPISYSGSLADLKGYTIGVLHASAQAEELKASGVMIEAIDHQVQNIKKLLKGRIDAMLIPRLIFFYHAARLDDQFDASKVKVLKPPYKTYDMYVAFSKKHPEFRQLTTEFNRGLRLIKADGTYSQILDRHQIRLEDENGRTIDTQ